MRTYLNVPYSQKDAARRLGARWDGISKRWYVENVVNIAAFTRWMPEHLLRPASSKKAPAAGKGMGK